MKYSICLAINNKEIGLTSKTIDMTAGITKHYIKKFGAEKILYGIMRENKNPEIIEAILFEGTPEDGKEIAKWSN